MKKSLLFLSWLLVLPHPVLAKVPLFLYEGLIAHDHQQALERQKSYTLQLQSLRPQQLQKTLARLGISSTVEAGGLRVPHLSGEERPLKLPKLQRASFLIDYLHIAFTELKRQVEARFGKRPSVAQLRAFVIDYLKVKIYYPGFSAASFLAKHPAGDTTEHAVLLTALLRLYGYPAVMLMGVAALPGPRGPLMVERARLFYFKERWIPLDPLTPLEERVGVKPYFFIPHYLITDEGVAFEGHLRSQRRQKIYKLKVL